MFSANHMKILCIEQRELVISESAETKSPVSLSPASLLAGLEIASSDFQESPFKDREFLNIENILSTPQMPVGLNLFMFFSR